MRDDGVLTNQAILFVITTTTTMAIVIYNIIVLNDDIVLTNQVIFFIISKFELLNFEQFLGTHYCVTRAPVLYL